MTNLYAKVGDVVCDGLVAGIRPAIQVGAKTIRKLGTAATLKRGTIMAKSSTDDKLVILGSVAAEGETLTPDCILTDDVAVGTTSDVITTAYTAGLFNSAKTIVAEDHTITAAEKDALRKYDIVLTAALNY